VTAAPTDVEDLRTRLERAAATTRACEIDALLVSPGADLRYLTGYDAVPLERLTCLVVPADGDPVLVAPTLEVPAAQASPIGALGLPVHGWDETSDPYHLVASLASGSATVAVSDGMAARHVLRLRAAMPAVEQSLAGRVLRELRMRKSRHEVDALAAAAAAIDRVHANVPRWLRAGRTEREIGRDIAEAILDEGHARVDFVIVGSGPNGASPHHELSDRVLAPGDPVVVDIGGTMPDGYCSDATRTYCVGEPPPDFAAAYAALQRAQAAAVAHVAQGVTAGSVDATAREVLADAGLADAFIHRLGHGIGLETHEEPYLVDGNDELLDVGMAFSVEPGVYFAGRYGARIEDIVVVTPEGARSLNERPRELAVV
jgi:Xaa-Pro aminopeptidase